jgi:hypothetical protein
MKTAMLSGHNYIWHRQCTEQQCRKLSVVVVRYVLCVHTFLEHNLSFAVPQRAVPDELVDLLHNSA